MTSLLYDSMDSTKSAPVPDQTSAATMVVSAAVHFDGWDAGYDRHVDFENVSPPDLLLKTSPGDKNAVETSAGSTDFRSIPAADLVEVHRCEFFSHRPLQVPQKPVAHRDVFVPARALRQLQCGADGRRQPAVLAGRQGHESALGLA